MKKEIIKELNGLEQILEKYGTPGASGGARAGAGRKPGGGKGSSGKTRTSGETLDDRIVQSERERNEGTFDESVVDNKEFSRQSLRRASASFKSGKPSNSKGTFTRTKRVLENKGYKTIGFVDKNNFSDISVFKYKDGTYEGKYGIDEWEPNAVNLGSKYFKNFNQLVSFADKRYGISRKDLGIIK